MKKFYCLLIVLAAVLSSCRIPDSPTDSDLSIVTANLLFSNTSSASEITGELLMLDADVYVLHEADLSVNIDEELFIAAGYSVHSFNESLHTAFNSVMASRLPATFEYINLEYSYGFDPVYIKPFYAARVFINSVPVSIIGAHIPPAIMMPDELKALRLKAFTEISSMVEDGKLIETDTGTELKTDDYVIIAGDLNTFPSDELLSAFLKSGLNDSILSGNNKYDFTWSPGGLFPFLARIDYIFHSKHLSAASHSSHLITGSDHKAVQAGFSIR